MALGDELRRQMEEVLDVHDIWPHPVKRLTDHDARGRVVEAVEEPPHAPEAAIRARGRETLRDDGRVALPLDAGAHVVPKWGAAQHPHGMAAPSQRE